MNKGGNDVESPLLHGHVMAAGLDGWPMDGWLARSLASWSVVTAINNVLLFVPPQPSTSAPLLLNENLLNHYTTRGQGEGAAKFTRCTMDDGWARVASWLGCWLLGKDSSSRGRAKTIATVKQF